MADTTIFTLPHTKQQVCLVPREMMRAPKDAKRASMPGAPIADLPPAPPTLDLTKGGAIDLPMLGNDRVGNCYLVDAYHQAQVWSGQNGSPLDLNADQIVKEYFGLTGGRDVGLYTDQIMSHFMNGLKQGNLSIEDWLVVPYADPELLRKILHAFGGLSFTLGIPNRWMNEFRPGAVIDAARGDRPNPNAGHAMTCVGYDPVKGWQMATWGYTVHLTQRALGVCDAEFIGWISKMWAVKGKAPNGASRTVLEEAWESIGGDRIDLGEDEPEPGPGPGPGPDGEEIRIEAGAYEVQAQYGVVTFTPHVHTASLRDQIKALDFGRLLEILAMILELLSGFRSKVEGGQRFTGGVRDRGGQGPHPVDEHGPHHLESYSGRPGDVGQGRHDATPQSGETGATGDQRLRERGKRPANPAEGHAQEESGSPVETGRSNPPRRPNR